MFSNISSASFLQKINGQTQLCLFIKKHFWKTRRTILTRDLHCPNSPKLSLQQNLNRSNFFRIDIVLLLIASLLTHSMTRKKQSSFTLNYQAFIIGGIRKKSDRCLMGCLIPVYLWMNLNKSAILRIVGERMTTFWEPSLSVL